MNVSELLHFAFRASNPEKLSHWYAELFEGQFFLHPVMVPLGIFIIKLNHPQALFRGLLEFWPWDVVWDGQGKVFRKITPHPSPTSYGHLAVKVAMDCAAIVAELNRRKIPYRMEPRGVVLEIPVIDDPEGNMIELFPNIDNMEVPPQALCSREMLPQALATLKKEFEHRLQQTKIDAEQGFPLLLFEEAGEDR